MLKQKIITLLIGLMCYSSASGFFTVLCHGSDGHIALESAAHNHCEHPEADQTEVLDAPFCAFVGTPAEHTHCKDTMVALETPLPAKKNTPVSIYKVTAISASLKQILSHTVYLFTPPAIARFCESSRFHEPLRTIVLRT